MTVEYWLINGSTRLRFPVNPEVNSYNSPFSFTEAEVEELGQVTTIGQRGLREFSLRTFWPRDYNPTYCSYSGFITPHQFLEYIEKWRDDRKPVRYVATGASAINRYVTIRDLQVDSEQAGSPGDIYFTMILVEYKEPQVTRFDESKPVQNQTTTNQRPAAEKPTPVKSYTVKKDDTLQKIAKRPEVYGDWNQWRKIYEANKTVIGKDPNNIEVGQKLVIPR